MQQHFRGPARAEPRGPHVLDVRAVRRRRHRVRHELSLGAQVQRRHRLLRLARQRPQLWIRHRNNNHNSKDQHHFNDDVADLDGFDHNG